MRKGPPAQAVSVTSQQRTLLERISRERASGYSLVQRARVVLSAAEGTGNTAIQRQQGIGRGTVQRWRRRWQANVARLNAVEGSDELEAAMRGVLSDEARSGAPGKFSAEQQVKIVAVACEDPQLSGCPLSHWTPQALADEVIKREIVESISARSIGRFLKRGRAQAAFKPILAQQPTQRRSRSGGVRRASGRGV
jgi:putative transposase